MGPSRKTSESPQPESVPVAPGASLERLWTPWRMPYVMDSGREPGCLFCSRLAENDDARTLILYRGNLAFVIMNLFPYNTGHVMIVPNAHVASPEDADPQMLAQMAALRGPVLRALRRALTPEGFNLGLNVGAVAGAGVTDHLHEHVVPRWQGDANFMPILASTMVMPEFIPVTYAKLRAEIARELDGSATVSSLILSPNGELALITTDATLPKVTAGEHEPLWRAALRDTRDRGAKDPELIGWAGNSQAGEGKSTLLIRASFPDSDVLPPRHRLAATDELLAGPNAGMVRDALLRLGITHKR